MAVHIGTSGWHYNHWRGPFYPEKFPAAKMLDYYTKQFDTVEINNSFYRLPPETAVENWRESTPRGFCFALKGSRYLTHMKKLKDPTPGIEKFMQRADLLEKKLGPIVFQLPPWWELNLPRLEEFLEALPERHRYAFELRNETWRTEEVYRRAAPAQRGVLHLRTGGLPHRANADREFHVRPAARTGRRLRRQLRQAQAGGMGRAYPRLEKRSAGGVCILR